MSAARFAEPFLTEPSIKLLISRLNATSKSFPISQLKSDFHALHPGGRSQLAATLSLLKAIGLLSGGIEKNIPDQEIIKSEHNISVQSFAHRLIEWMGTGGLIAEFIEALQYDDEHETVVLDTLRVPWRLNYIKHLLREIGVFSRDDVNVRHWTINAEYSQWFLEAAKKETFSSTSKSPMSIEELQRVKEQQNILGEQAEEWALSYEKQRLAEHPFVALIRRVSTSDVSAGYDIISFSSLRSLSHDRFIEIKSFSHELRFFWSVGEIQKARILGNKYILMLVDRKKVSEPDYEPTEIPDPYNYFFSTTPKDWDINSTEWMIERK